jgi:hypothetical protein
MQKSTKGKVEESLRQKNARIMEEYISRLPTLKPRTLKKYSQKLPSIAERLL